MEPYALTTLPRAKAYLRRKPEDVSADERIEILVDAFSKAIIGYVRREFLAVETEERTFEHNGTGLVSLAPYDLRTIDAVTIEGTAYTAGSPASGRHYRPLPVGQTPEGTYWNLRVPDTVEDEAAIVVVGSWGIGHVPTDVELACLIAVDNGFHNPGAFGSRTFGDLAVVQETEQYVPNEGQSLPPDSRALLSPYRRG